MIIIHIISSCYAVVGGFKDYPLDLKRKTVHFSKHPKELSPQKFFRLKVGILMLLSVLGVQKKAKTRTHITSSFLTLLIYYLQRDVKLWKDK